MHEWQLLIAGFGGDSSRTLRATGLLLLLAGLESCGHIDISCRGGYSYSLAARQSH
jgi:hypothetical protein